MTDYNFKELVGPGFWMPNDVPLDRLHQIGGHFNHSDTFVAFASGHLPFFLTERAVLLSNLLSVPDMALLVPFPFYQVIG